MTIKQSCCKTPRARQRATPPVRRDLLTRCCLCGSRPYLQAVAAGGGIVEVEIDSTAKIIRCPACHHGGTTEQLNAMASLAATARRLNQAADA